MSSRTGEDKGSPARSIALRSGGRLYAVNPGTVLWVEADRNYATLHRLGAPPLRVRHSLEGLGELLGDGLFTRIHRSRLVRVSAIRFVCGSQVVLLNGARLTGSVRLVRKLLRTFGRTRNDTRKGP